MRSSAVLVGAVLFALATASPHPENPAQGEHGLLVSRADDLSPELAQVVANNGATSGCFSSISTPAVPAKLRKRQALDLSQESCPNIDTTICRQGFTPLCCDPDLYYDPSTSNHLPGTIESGCTPSGLLHVLEHSLKLTSIYSYGGR